MAQKSFVSRVWAHHSWVGWLSFVLVVAILVWPTSNKKEERIAPPEQKPAPVATVVVAPVATPAAVVIAPPPTPPVVVAPVQSSPPPQEVVSGKPDHFRSAEDCSRAVRSGEFEYYTPRFYGNHVRNPADGVTKVVASLPEVACVYEHTVYGVPGRPMVWVAQKKGDRFRFQKNPDGSLESVPYAREDCGNLVRGITYPLSKQVEPPPVQVPPPPQQPPQPAQVQQAPAPAVAVAPPFAQVNICEAQKLTGKQYFPGFNPDGTEQCFMQEVVPWYAWGNIKKPVVVAVGVAVTAIVIARCSKEGRCGDPGLLIRGQIALVKEIIKGKSSSTTTSSTTTTTNAPVGSQAIGNTGGTGGQAIGSTGAVGSTGTGGTSAVGGGATY